MPRHGDGNHWMFSRSRRCVRSRCVFGSAAPPLPLRVAPMNPGARAGRRWLLWLTGLAVSLEALAAPALTPFATMTDDALPPPWREVSLGHGVEPNGIALVSGGAGVVLELRSSASASGVAHPLAHHPDAQLRWRWKVSAPLSGLDPRRRGGDDYAARVYVLFGPPAERSGFLHRWRSRIQGWISDTPVPATTLCYVWSGEAAMAGAADPDSYPSPYSSDVRILIATRGRPAADDGWVTVQRSLADDHLHAFGSLPGRLIAVVLAADTDNSGARATAWFDSLELLPAAPRPSRQQLESR